MISKVTRGVPAGRPEDRRSFLDALRILATCAVVLLHTVTGVKDRTDMSVYPEELKAFLVVMDFVTWCVPVFLLISGYLFLNPDRSIPFSQMVWKYCRRIVFALFLFGVPYACLELVAEEHAFRMGMIAEAIGMVCKGQSWSHMWYLYLILLLYLITPALKWILKRCPGWALYGVLAAILVFGSFFPFLKKWLGLEALWALPDHAIYLFYYLSGYLFVTRKERSAQKTSGQKPFGEEACRGKRFWTLLLLTLLLLGSMTAIRMGQEDSVQLPYNYPFTVALSLLVFSLAEGLETVWQKHKKAWKNTGALCFTVYLVHPVFINLAYKALHLTPLDYPLWIAIPVFFAVILGLSVLTAWVLGKISILKRYVL